MDKPRIDTAPSPDRMKAVMEIYRDLGPTLCGRVATTPTRAIL
jgi:hypothetical protein